MEYVLVYKNSGEVLSKLKSIGFCATSLSTYVFILLRTSLSNDNQADIIEAFNSTSRYPDDLLNIDNPHYFKEMVNQIYPPELQLNKVNVSEIGPLFGFTSIYFLL